MIGTVPAPSAPLLAVLDDTASAAVALELSSALARALGRGLSLVYVESARSLVAAALPFTRVLPPTGSQWVPLSPEDVEQGFRAHAQRLRQLAARAGLRDRLNWSLRVMRGDLQEVAGALWGESDLMLMVASPPVRAPATAAAPQGRQRPEVLALVDGSELSVRVQGVATTLAQALAGTMATRLVPDAAALAADAPAQAALARAAVLVLPRGWLAIRAFAALRCPLLLVG